MGGVMTHADTLSYKGGGSMDRADRADSVDRADRVDRVIHECGTRQE
jgi:hypothetical protein